MTILLVSSIPLSGTGGSSAVMRDIVDHARAYGHRVDTLTYARDGPKVGEADTAYCIRPRRMPGLSSCVMLARLLACAFFGRYDLVVCGVAHPSAILAWITHRLTGRPYAVFAYGEDVTEVEGSRLKTWLLTRALRDACAILPISTFTRRRIEALGVPPERITDMPLWVDTARFDRISSADVATRRAQLGLAGKRVILTVARLEERKGHDTVIRALRSVHESVPEVHYVIVGSGDQQALRELAAAEGVADRVQFMGRVPDEDLPLYYHLCDVHVMVSRWSAETKHVEGFGLVYLEAASCSKPSIGGTAGGCPDAIEDGVTGMLVDPTSVEELGSALRVLLTDMERAAAMGEAGRRRVCAQFCKDTRLQHALQVLGASIDQGSPRNSHAITR